jgi:hypothetical protein
MKRLSLFLFLFYFFIANKSGAQSYFIKPYLVIEDTVEQKIFRIKQKNVFIRTTKDSEAQRDRLLAFISDSVIVTKNHPYLKISDIESISFRPAKAKRTFKQVVTVTTAAIEVVNIYYAMKVINGPPTEGGGGIVLIIFAIGLPPLYVTGTQISGAIVQAITPWKTFYKKDIKMYVVQE